MVSSCYEEKREGDISPEEKFHCDAIEKEKAAYKETLERLRGLKSTIENAQKMAEKGRLKLQSDFDMWYHHMCCEQSQIETSYSSSRSISNSTASKSNKIPSKTTPNDKRKSPSHVVEAKRVSEDVKQPDNQAQNDFKLPPGIKLTGNPEADEDIIAFYKAKEVLLSRAKR